MGEKNRKWKERKEKMKESLFMVAWMFKKRGIILSLLGS